jgi:hypothetical protein
MNSAIEALQSDIERAERAIANTLDGAAEMIGRHGAEFEYDVHRIEVTTIGSAFPRYKHVVTVAARVRRGQ